MNLLADYKSLVAIYLKTEEYLSTQLSAWDSKVRITDEKVIEKKNAIFYRGILW